MIRLIARCLFIRSRNVLGLGRAGSNTETDEALLYVINELTGVKSNEDEYANYEKLKGRINEWKSKVQNDDLILKLIEFNDVLWEDIHQSYEQAKNEIVGKDKGDYKALSSSDLKEYNKTLREILKIEEFELIDRVSPKYKFSWQEFTSLLAIGSAFISIGAYIYTRIFYNGFHVKADYFFSIGDYVQTGIYHVPETLFQILVLFIFMNFPDSNFRESSMSGPRTKRANNIFWASLIIVIVLGVFNNFVLSKPPYDLIRVLGILILFRISFFFSSRYFEHKLNTFYMLLMPLFFLLNMTISAYKNIHMIKSSDYPEKLEIVFKDAQNLTLPKDYVTLGFNSKFVFVSDTLFNKTYTISMSDVKLIINQDESR
ncbi:MAG: hypothetical protein Roseis2KO_07150 [Roseivirga sp.]